MKKTQPWTVKGRKVLSLSGEWWTPRRLLLEVKRHILAHPKSYDQYASVFDDAKGCQTVACIAGWAALLTTGAHQSFTMIGDFLNPSTRIKRRNSLWPWLFEGQFDHGPVVMREAQLVAGTSKQKAKVAAMAIELFIKRGMK